MAKDIVWLKKLFNFKPDMAVISVMFLVNTKREASCSCMIATPEQTCHSEANRMLTSQV